MAKWRNHPTSSSDRGVQSVAACGPPRFRDAMRCGGDASGFSGTTSRRSAGPTASIRRAGRPGVGRLGGPRPTRQRQWTGSQVRHLSPVASLCPAEGGIGGFRPAGPERRRPRVGERRGSGGTARCGASCASEGSACRSTQVSTGGDTAVEPMSIRRRQRLRQGVCRFLDGARARFRGREPNGSERRRVRLWSGGPTNSGTQSPTPFL